jgi:GNAT superfamily N-acetyltransferase
MKQEERADLTARLNIFLKESPNDFPDGTTDELVKQIEYRASVLSESEAEEQDYFFVILHQERECQSCNGPWKQITIAITNLTGTAFASMDFDPAYDPIIKDPVCGFIRYFHVNEDRRRMGIGTLMLLVLESAARDFGVHILFLPYSYCKVERLSWGANFIAKMGYHSYPPNDDCPFHYVQLHKRLFRRY